jgi:hypothetical protein
MLELSGQSGETPSSLVEKAVRMDMPRHHSLVVVCMPAQCLRRAFNAWSRHTSNRVHPLKRFSQLKHARLVEHMNERGLDPMVGSGRMDYKNRELMISELVAYIEAYLDSLDVPPGGRLTQASSADAPSATEATAAAQPEISADLLVGEEQFGDPGVASVLTRPLQLKQVEASTRVGSNHEFKKSKKRAEPGVFQ